MAIITLVFGREILGTRDIDTDKLIIGRADDCDITVDNLAVSRHHAIIEKAEGVFTIKDLDSNNGTFVNGQRIGSPTVLNFGDEIGIGKHTLVFDSHSKKVIPGHSSTSSGGTQPDMDAAARGTMFVEPKQMEKIQEKVTATRKAHLEIPGTQDKIIVLEKSDVVFGKASNCDVVISGFFVSRRHAILSHLQKGFQLINFAVLSPTRVNGMVIDSTLLCNGDEIKIGKSRFIFRAGK